MLLPTIPTIPTLATIVLLTTTAAQPAGTSHESDRFVPIDFADEMNIYLDRKDQFGGFHNSANFPRPGRHELGGVPFMLGGTAESGEITYGWNGYYANARYGDGRKPRTLVIKTDLPNVDAVHTIMQTFWSMPHGQSAVAMEFIGSDGARAHVAFSAGVNIRDYNHGHLRPHGAIQVAPIPRHIVPNVIGDAVAERFQPGRHVVAGVDRLAHVVQQRGDDQCGVGALLLGEHRGLQAVLELRDALAAI